MDLKRLISKDYDEITHLNAKMLILNHKKSNF